MIPQEITDQIDKVILTGQNVGKRAKHAEALDREKDILKSMIFRYAEREVADLVDYYEAQKQKP